jgi:molecular chaperone GrpE
MSAEPRKKDIPKGQSATPPAVEELSPAEDFTPAAASPEEAPEEAMAKTVLNLQAENKQLMDQLLRKQAELENFRKRAEREKEEFLQYSLFDTVKSLLPILDGFELALISEGIGEDYRKGVELIYQQLQGVLQKLGLKTMETKGHQFNPRLHEAVAATETDQCPEHQIAEELQRGYFFKDRLLRPAMVTVAKRRAGQNNTKENALSE